MVVRGMPRVIMSGAVSLRRVFESADLLPYDSFGRKFVQPGEMDRDRKSGRPRNDNKRTAEFGFSKMGGAA
jgi:hypothetical protein